MGIITFLFRDALINSLRTFIPLSESNQNQLVKNKNEKSVFNQIVSGDDNKEHVSIYAPDIRSNLELAMIFYGRYKGGVHFSPSSLRSSKGCALRQSDLHCVGVSPLKVNSIQQLRGGLITQLRRYFVRPTSFSKLRRRGEASRISASCKLR